MISLNYKILLDNHFKIIVNLPLIRLINLPLSKFNFFNLTNDFPRNSVYVIQSSARVTDYGSGG